MTSSEANETKPEVTVSQTAEFVDANVGEILSFKTLEKDVKVVDAQHDLGLAEFLSRPTLISTSTWTPSNFTNASVNPWYAYLNNAAIKSRIANFAYFRGDLHIKVVVNCSPFYYGAVLCYYTPASGFGNFNLASTTVDYVTTSQRPHIWIYPQTSSGGEMTVPFIYHKNFVELGSATNVQGLGSLSYKLFTALISANGATSNGCTIQTYAWMENVTLMGNTTAAVLQSGKDEYGNGPVSAPAAILSNWVGHLKSVPIIGKYATATQIGSSAVSQIAKLFGWSNVPVIEDVKPMKNLPFHDMASAHLSEPTSKMTLDPKGEISVDPSIIGANPEDEMAIAKLVQHESFLCSSTWATTDTVGTQFLLCNVTPMLYDRGTASTGGTYGIAMTPMCWVSRAFSAWRGDIIFRFKIICSRFHQGRLRISWDPTATNDGTTDNTNVIITKIVDLAESDEVEFRVPYMQPMNFSRTFTTSTDINNANNFKNGSGTLTQYADMFNGTITVKCLTNLSAPIDSASVSIFTFVRAADNFVLANPTDLPRSTSFIQMQSGVACLEDDNIDEDLFKVNFGDPVLSLRTLLRRTVRHDSMFVYANSTQLVQAIFRQGRRAYMPGYDPNGWFTAKGVETTGTSYPFNGVYMTHLAWFSPAFVCERGSIRWHYNVTDMQQATPQAAPMIEVARSTQTPVTGTSSGNQRAITLWTNFASPGLDTWVYDLLEKGMSGLVLTNQFTQTGISVEMPMNSLGKYVYTRADTAVTGSTVDGSVYDTYAIRILAYPGGASTSIGLHRYVSAGTDFGLYFFLSVPVLYYNSGMGQTSP
jgi:hypothetical protein